MQSVFSTAPTNWAEILYEVTLMWGAMHELRLVYYHHKNAWSPPHPPFRPPQVLLGEKFSWHWRINLISSSRHEQQVSSTDTLSWWPAEVDHFQHQLSLGYLLLPRNFFRRLCNGLNCATFSCFYYDNSSQNHDSLLLLAHIALIYIYIYIYIYILEE